MNGNGERYQWPQRDIRKQAATKELMNRAKASRAQTNKAFADLAEGLKTTENTLEAIMAPVGKFLTTHCGFKDGQPLPLWDDLYEALSVPIAEDRVGELEKMLRTIVTAADCSQEGYLTGCWPAIIQNARRLLDGEEPCSGCQCEYEGPPQEKPNG